MKIKKLLFKILESFFKIIGIGTAGVFSFVYYIVLLLIFALLNALIINWFYLLLQPEITDIILPTIGYWSWFKIVIIVKVLFNGLGFNNTKIKNHKKEKPERTSTLKN